jgi:radical SAM protein with 4Fe4S-binding SPASM domain
MLTPFATGYVDLQSPTGAGIGAVAYNYDGGVYASDEARMLAAMGDESFKLGDVQANTFEEIFGGETLRALVASSILEILPGCSDCAFVPYCGADPVFHHRTQGDIVGHRPTSAFCTKNMEILRYLFDLIRGEDPFVRDLLTQWATGVCLMVPQQEVVS